MPYSADQLELLAHIRAENAKFDAACKAQGATFWTLMVEDLDHWASCGVTTVAQYRSYQIRSNFSDSYKMEHGMRPDLSRYTDDQMVEIMDGWAKNHQAKAHREEKAEASTHSPSLTQRLPLESLSFARLGNQPKP